MYCLSGISVIIPVLNGSGTIAETIQSVLAQELACDLDVIVSDDGSSDDTVRIAESFGPPVMVIHKPAETRNKGPSAARNRGILYSRQEYVSFLDADDMYLPDHLQRAVRTLNGNPHIGFVFCRTLMMRGNNAHCEYAEWTKQRITRRDMQYPVVSRGRIVHTSALVFRRTVFDAVGSFDESISNGEDTDMWMRVCEQYQGVFLDYFGSVYRIMHSKNQLTNRKNYTMIRTCQQKVGKKAIARCLTRKPIDHYYLFRLRLRHACLHDRKVVALLNIFVKHPIHAALALVDSSALRPGSRTAKWYPLSKYMLGSKDITNE